MKLKYLFVSLAAVLSVFTSCSDEYSAKTLGEIQVSSSYIAIPMGGGSTTIDMKTTDSYEITCAPSWLTITPSTGEAGETALTFSADATLDGRNTEAVRINCAGQQQVINVIQGLATVSTATCAEVIAGVDNKTYKVKGICTAIANTTYGNFYMNDGTGEIYIYGTKDASGNYNWASFGIEVGDEVTVQGPKATYNGTVELVDAAFVSVSKSLIKVNTLTVGNDTTNTLPVEGGEITAHLTNKGGSVNVSVPEDAASWLSIKSISGNDITFKAAANEGGDRSTTLVFTTVSGGKTYTAQTDIVQKGAIVNATVAEFNAAPVGDTYYRVTGVISSVNNAAKGRFYIKDATGETYVYNMSGFEATGLKAGDIVTLVGKRAQYNTTIEMTNATLEASIVVPEVSVADFRNLDDDATKSKYYMISGTVEKPTESGTKWDVETYGNFNINDGTGSVYVYGVIPGWGGSKGTFGQFGIKEGDKITIIAYKSSYKGLVEACGAMYFSSTPAN